MILTKEVRYLGRQEDYTNPDELEEKNLSVRYHLKMVVTILWSRFVKQLIVHRSFIIGVFVGMGIMSVVMLYPLLDLGIKNYYNQPTQELVLLPAPTDTEIIDTELTGDSSGFNFTGRFIANNQPVNDFECSLDGGEYVGCAQSVKIDNIESGEHTFEVRSVLGNGTVDPTPAASIFLVK